MSNFCQLMIARGVAWLMVSDEVPWPLTVAAPPTTLGLSGLAIAEASPSGTRAELANITLRMRARLDMLVPERGDEEETPVIAGTLDGLGGRQVEQDHVLPPPPDPAAR